MNNFQLEEVTIYKNDSCRNKRYAHITEMAEEKYDKRIKKSRYNKSSRYMAGY